MSLFTGSLQHPLFAVRASSAAYGNGSVHTSCTAPTPHSDVEAPLLSQMAAFRNVASRPSCLGGRRVSVASRSCRLVVRSAANNSTVVVGLFPTRSCGMPCTHHLHTAILRDALLTSRRVSPRSHACTCITSVHIVRTHAHASCGASNRVGPALNLTSSPVRAATAKYRYHHPHVRGPLALGWT